MRRNKVKVNIVLYRVRTDHRVTESSQLSRIIGMTDREDEISEGTAQ